MAERRIKRALLSVYDKTGLVDFARALVEEFEIELISTGGTARTLTEAGLPVTLVEDVTGFPEMMDGRVKTLHPKIHGAILADRDNTDHMRQLAEQGIEPIDMVVVNLYPFEQTIARPDCTFGEAIEMIDIGGPCLLRAAAKNHRHVLVVSEVEQFAWVLRILRGETTDVETEADFRQRNAAAVYAQTSMYDCDITRWLGQNDRISGWPTVEAVYTRNWGELRYGENPHQQGEAHESLETDDPLSVITAVEQEGAETELSFNNYADASAALELCAELAREKQQATCCFIKHTNACGSAIGDDPVEVYRRAYLGDPNAAMGGILAVNFPVDADFAEVVMETYGRFGKPLKDAGHPQPPGAFFVEVWIAPRFDDDAVEVIRGQAEGKPQKAWGKRVRLLAVGDLSAEPDAGEMDIKRIAGGVLLQTRDLVGLNEDQWQVVTKRHPTPAEMEDLRLAWLVCKHTKSNAITICKDGMLLGSGAGQMSRVMSCRIATWLSKENGHDTAGAVAASDAFFPFRDGPDILADAGVRAIIQPGGSKRDEDTIAACDERGIAMVFTGTRHFKH